MLKNISLHVDSEESRQRMLEQEVAPIIDQRRRQNLNAIRRHMPSVGNYLSQDPHSSISLICNKHGELNIIDYQTGRVLYGEHPKDDSLKQVAQFCRFPLRIAFSSRNRSHAQQSEFLKGLMSPSVQGYRDSAPIEENIDVLVVLGLGLGFHIEHLIREYEINHLVVYEPELAYLRSSLNTMDWKFVLEEAKRKNIALYFQLGKDGSELAANLEELSEHVKVDGFYLLQHYPSSMFNQIHEKLAQDGWEEFPLWIPGSKQFRANQNYVSAWQAPISAQTWTADNLDYKLFKKNLDALKKYFPKLHDEFSTFEPQDWRPLANEKGEVNLFNQDTLAALYSDTPIDDCVNSFSGFAKKPNKDSLVLGYSGRKLKSYLHYQLVEKVQAVLDDIEESQGELSETIKSMIVFGLGLGYQLPHLFEHHKVEKLFICEPNRDYFYASLYAIDWATILRQVDDNEGRLYLNIGDDGSNLINDLLHQFHSIGPYVLASTYFYQGYYNAELAKAIAQLREQLQVIISMGDYFDHSRFGIAHTKWAIEQGTPFMQKDAASQLPPAVKETPVFIVGNGPSLDNLLPLIKEHENQAIIVSCGTALQSLHRNGIAPDFHAEIEINRSTFDWACRVGDFEYLKKITLISCNGIHPDTCELYKDVLLAFKEGESSTVSVMELYPKHNWKILSNSYPTVTNFAVDFVTSLGLDQLYLCGVDMGFVDKEHHHSKSSGYYKDGKQVYDYSSINNTSLVIPGNFRPYVNTKYEFKVSKAVLEKSCLASKAEVYNMNDGARIEGARPLKPEDLLILHGDGFTKQDTIAFFREASFSSVEEFPELFRRRYQSAALEEELDAFALTISQEVKTSEEAEKLITEQRDLLVASFQRKQSLLFFYLNGTLNYINSALRKILNIAEKQKVVSTVNTIFEAWQLVFQDIKGVLIQAQFHFDHISTYHLQRRAAYIQYKNIDTLGFSIFPKEKQYLRDSMFYDKYVMGKDGAPQKLIFAEDYSSESLRRFASEYAENCCFIVSNLEKLNVVFGLPGIITVVYLPGDAQFKKYAVGCSDITRVLFAAYAVLEEKISKIIVPKLRFTKEQALDETLYDFSNIDYSECYSMIDSVWLVKGKLKDNAVTRMGDRVAVVPRFRVSHIVGAQLSSSEYKESKLKLQTLLEKVK